MRFLSCRLCWLLRLLAIVFSCCVFRSLSCTITRNKSQEHVPAVFAFGDSMVDTGNNNELLTMARCNFAPYGRDFQGHKATGRFTNGRICPDLLVEELGIKKNLPAYLDPNLKEKDLFTGVSFGSAGGGYDPLTSQIILVKTLEDQLSMFKEYIRRVKSLVGQEGTNFILNGSIYLVLTGNNDIANTFASTPFRSDYDADSYTDLMLVYATSFLRKLYKLGARKIVVSNLPPLGCLPAQRTLRGGLFKRDCAVETNEAVHLFNSKLKHQLESLSTELPNFNHAYIDFYDILLDITLNPTVYGIEVVDKGCCGSGLLEVGVLCNSFSVLCEDPSKYFYWDSYHPTERGNEIIHEKMVEKYFPLFS